MTDKFCRDCHWARNKMTSDLLWVCTSPKNVLSDKRLSLVTGSPERYIDDCKIARTLRHACGREGNWFQTTKELFPDHYKVSTTSIRPSAISLEDL